MITLEKTQEISKCLNNLSKDVERAVENQDFLGLKCLNLWNLYQTYLQNLILKFPMNTNNKENLEIFDKLRLYAFQVDAKGKFESEKKKMLDYIEECKKNIMQNM